MQKLEKQICPICKKNDLILIEEEKDIPHFGRCYLFSMNCNSCKFSKADIESMERKDPTKYTLEVNSKKDLNIKVVKSSEATIKIPNLKLSVTPGAGSEGYISNVEGVLKRFKDIVEAERDNADDEEIKRKAKILLKKFWKIELGEMPVKVIIEDPSGNSAILSEKATVEKLKK